MTIPRIPSIRGALAALLAGAALTGCGGPADGAGTASSAALRGDHQDGAKGSVSAHLGGRAGILAFLETAVVPAELADPEIAPFFTRLTETPGDIDFVVLPGGSLHDFRVLAEGAVLAVVSHGLAAEA
jgi:hypothetical protein